jgi:lipoyl-dependent peroxiredoxin
MKRKATAIWHGTLKEGKGHLSTQSGVLQQTPYNFKMRFEDEKGTNPEELIGAAHSGCFTMQLSAFLAEEGYNPVELETKAEVSLENGSITASHLFLTAKVPGIDREQFNQLATKAKENCPVSKLLKADISLDITLNE